jgi:ATP-dependent helicase IRC3
MIHMAYSIQLRDYQKEALQTVLEEVIAGTSRQLIVLPTGAGKTIVMAAIARHLNKKTIILAHREELISQAIDKFQLFWPGVSIGVCMAERNEIDCQVVVGSVQSCSRPKRLDRLRAQGFEVMMIDEAHHSASDSYQSVINAFGFGNGSEKLLLGVTATPQRSDNLGLGGTLDKITYSRSIGTMIKAGYLSPVVGRKILTNLNLGKIHIQNGDFSLGELSEIVNTAERNKFIVSKFQEYATGRKAIAFCVDVRHSQDLANSFKEAGIVASAVWGDMGSDERKNALESLKSGKIQIATSCGVLCEGFDEPSIDAVIMARPTKSTGLYTQCVGRGLRKHPGKEDCLILDFTDRHHTLDNVVTLKCTIPEAVHVEEETEQLEAIEEVDNRPKLHILNDVDREFDVLGSVRFSWVDIGSGEWSLIDDDRKEIVLSPQGDGYIAKLYHPQGTASDIVKKPIPLQYCFGVAEDFARRNLKTSFANPRASWMQEDEEPTDGQREFLEKNDAFDEEMTKAKASLKIREIIALKNKQRRALNDEPITDKQRYFLGRYGVDTSTMSKFQAMQTISRIKSGQKVA